MNDIELRPCPHCDGKAKMTYKDNLFWVECPSCKSWTVSESTVSGAIAAWNSALRWDAKLLEAKADKRREYLHEYYIKNKERINARSISYYAEHKERMREYQRGYYAANRERRCQYFRKRYAEKKSAEAD